jgi:hypothetical protein
MACWVFKGKGKNPSDATIYTFSGCFSNPSWGPSVYNDGSLAPHDNGSPLFSGWGSVNNSLTQVFNQAQLNSLVAGTQNYGHSCANCFNTFYDCINGKCVSSLTGIYASLEECQQNCGGGGTGCSPPNICVPPGMKCIPEEDYSIIEGLAIALESSACR